MIDRHFFINPSVLFLFTMCRLKQTNIEKEFKGIKTIQADCKHEGFQQKLNSVTCKQHLSIHIFWYLKYNKNIKCIQSIPQIHFTYIHFN